MVAEISCAKIRDYVSRNHGWSSVALEKSEEFADYQAEMDKIRQFNGKRVRLEFIYATDLSSGSGEKVGRIKVDGGRIKFYEGKKTARHYCLDAGLYLGWFATLVPKKIVALN